MASLTSYGIVGAAEDISDLIANISPTATPFISSLKTEKITNVLHQWQEDSLRAVASNAQVEGYVATDDTLSATVMRNNVTQILTKVVNISETVDAEKMHGRSKETAYQLAKAAKEVKRELEYAAVGTKQTLVNTGAGVARQFAGAQAQIASGNITTTGGASTVMTEAQFVTCLQNVYTAGGDLSQVLVTPAAAMTVTNFASAAGRYRTVTSKITNAVSIYASPFGDVAVSIDRFLATTDTIVYDPDMWKLTVLRNWTRQPLAKVGDSNREMIVGEFSIKHLNQSASGMVRQA